MASDTKADRTMSSSEWMLTQTQIYLLAGMVARLPLDEFLEKAERADAIGPFVDPTLYIEKHDDLRCVTEVARALRQVKTRCAELGIDMDAARFDGSVVMDTRD